MMGGATAQTIAPQPPQGMPATQPAATTPPIGKVTTTEAERKGRTESEVYLGVYLSLDKDCKVGAQPKIEIVKAPASGKLRTRNHPINLRDVPGAPKRTCIGTSPNGIAVLYRSDRRFKGEDFANFRVVYPNGDVRDASVKISIQ